MNIIPIFGVVLGIYVHLNSVFGMSGDATFYPLGLTACGQVYTDNELVAAIALGYWKTPNSNNDPICNRTAMVTDPETGNNVSISIQDICGACSMEDIDLSPAAFQQLRPLDIGRFPVNWDFTNFNSENSSNSELKSV